METLSTILTIGFMITGILLVLLILLRKGEVASLSSAFGGVGGDTAFGVKAQKQLDKIITYVAIFFLLCGVVLNTPAFRVAKEKNTEPTKEAPATPGQK